MKSDPRISLRALAVLLLPSLLAACASAPQKEQAPRVVACADPAIVLPLPQEPSVTEKLLRYQQTLGQMSREELQREVAAQPAQPATPQAMLQKAMAMATLRGAGDLGRAQQLAELALRSPDADAGSFKPLAQLLATNYADLRRQNEQNERLAQQAREQQRRIDQLDHMLEGLKAIERNLATRPGPNAPHPK